MAVISRRSGVSRYHNVIRLNHFHVPIVLKSGSLNLLEPYGPLQTCNGIVLHLPYLYLMKNSYILVG
jgi:hypothetical protein